MAFNSAPSRAEYTATAGQTVFPFTFKIFLDGDIKVYLTPSGQTPDDTVDLLTITTDYTVSISGDNGGDITLVVGASAGDTITLVRVLDIDRLIEYQNNGDLLAETLNDDQDYQTYLIADKDAENTRFLRLPDTAQGVSATLPAPVSDAYFKWNADADAIENDTTIPDAVTDAAASAAAAAVSETNAANSASAASVSAAEAAASAASIDPTNIIHTDGSGEDNELSTLAVNLTTAQTVAGIKTFSASPLVPTATLGDDTTKAASTAFVLANRINGALTTDNLFHIQHQRSNGNQGGSAVLGLNIRILDTILTNTISGASLLSNQVTLPAGTYYVEASAPGLKINSHKAFLYNVTDVASEVIGTVERTDAVDGVTNKSFIYGEFTIAGTKVFEVHHYAEVAKTTNGLGGGALAGDSEVAIFTDIKIWKVG